MKNPFLELTDRAIDIAERASKIALSHFRHAMLIEIKENQTPVTIADKKTEEMIRMELEAAFPDWGIIGEEFGDLSKKSDFIWTIDPIDGTRSFIRGIPLWGTLLGLLHKGEPIVGVMVMPAINETYAAGKELGTRCNGVQIHASNTKSIESAFVSVGDVPCFEDTGRKKMLERLIEQSEVTRGYTDCFGHSMMLRGAVDAMIDPAVSIWDVAPIACLVKEAGGDYCDFEGNRSFTSKTFMSFTPALKADLLKTVG